MRFAKDSLTIITCTAIALLASSVLFGQQATPQPTFEVLELRLERLAAAIEQHSNKRDTLQKQLDSRAAEIEELKEKQSINFIERKRLETLLKESQDLSNEIAAADRQLREARQRFQQTGRQLLDVYDAEINRLLSALEKDESKAGRRYSQIQQLRERKKKVQVRVGLQRLETVAPGKLEIEPDDSPRKIRQKGDLLKDQEEKYRRLSQQFEARAGKLKKEFNLRNRIGDLVTDLAVFDQQEEAVGDPTVGRSTEQLSGIDNAPLREESSVATESGYLVGQKDFDFASMSPEQLEEAIAELQRLQQRAESQADSLANEAKKFYKAAEEFKKQ